MHSNKDTKNRKLDPSAMNKMQKAKRKRANGGECKANKPYTTTHGMHQLELRQCENELFNRYYAELQRIGCLSSHSASLESQLTNTLTDAEMERKAWQAEMELFRSPLPITIWINDTDPLASSISEHFGSLSSELVEPISWYPVKNMAWRIAADKTSIRKLPAMRELREYLIQQTAMGTISRQEEVSMIPPFLLDIQPNDVCLDMCASPGSKTAQMLVALGRHKMTKPQESSSTISSPFPFDYTSEGLVMANELDWKRANMLIHQVKRLRLLFPFALFTNHDARYFPEVPLLLSHERNDNNNSENENDNNNDDYNNNNKKKMECKFTSSSTLPDSNICPNSSDNKSHEKNAHSEETLRFDKILCDVVCSGDGTLRKAPHLFKTWTPREALGLQKTQIEIALRACHLLKIGGRLVYSTCSLNPIENEAVVMQIIRRTRGAMRLVDGRSLLPELSCAPGLTSWVVTDATGRVVSEPGSHMHVALFPPSWKSSTSSSCSVPTKHVNCPTTADDANSNNTLCTEMNEKSTHTSCEKCVPEITMSNQHDNNSTRANDHDYVSNVDLRLCMRFLPSHCNGGGFFIAVLDKVKEFRLIKKTTGNDVKSSEINDNDSSSENSCGSNNGNNNDNTDSTNNNVVCINETSVHEVHTGANPELEKNKNATECLEHTNESNGNENTEPNTNVVVKCKPIIPPQFVQVPHDIASEFLRFYEISQFPTENLFIRLAQGERTFTLTSSTSCSLVSETARRVLLHKTDSLTVVSAGIRVFAFETLNKGWRIASEAASLFARVMQHSSRLLHVPVRLVDEMINDGGKLKEKLLEDMGNMEESDSDTRYKSNSEDLDYTSHVVDTTEAEYKKQLAQLRSQIDALSLGTCLLAIDAPKAVNGVYYSVALRARSRLQLLVDHEDLTEMRLRLGLPISSPLSSTSTHIKSNVPTENKQH